VAFDAFLKIEGIPGDSVDQFHKGEIEVLGWEEGLTHPTSRGGAGGGGGAGRATFQDFHITTRVSTASPQLLLACASGQHLKTATLSVRKAGGEARQLDFMKFVLDDVLVSSVKTGGASTDESPNEIFTLNFLKIHVFFTSQSATGAAGSTTTAGWDLAGNRKV
jgi:type VI secretion system secreted protein Hcp